MLISHSLHLAEVEYNQFHEIYKLNHRTMYLDLPKAQDYIMNQPTVRGTLREIEDIVKFVKTIYEQLQKKNIFIKLELLQLEVSKADKPSRIAYIIGDQLELTMIKAKKDYFKYQRPIKDPISSIFDTKVLDNSRK